MFLSHHKCSGTLERERHISYYDLILLINRNGVTFTLCYVAQLAHDSLYAVASRCRLVDNVGVSAVNRICVVFCLLYF